MMVGANLAIKADWGRREGRPFPRGLEEEAFGTKFTDILFIY
jgi:hypothetical protein